MEVAPDFKIYYIDVPKQYIIKIEVNQFMQARVGKKSKKAERRESQPLSGLGRRYDVEEVDSIDVAVLEILPYEYPGKDIVVRIDTNEFTAVCPYSGLPDFATIVIEYVPGKVIIELRSLKYYLLSYRNVGIYQEHVVNRILEDLLACCKPKWMRVVADYQIRGGIHTVAYREWGKRPKGLTPGLSHDGLSLDDDR